MDIKTTINAGYDKIAKTSCSCKSVKLAKQIGYSFADITAVPEANMGLGCGNPTALAQIKEGDVVVDLGCGAGFDCFLAAKKVGTGNVIGVDFTDAMLDKARALAKKYYYTNISFIKGDIEVLPLPNTSADVVISNCVINLAPSKEKVFREAHRILKTNGILCISDIVLLGNLTPEQKQNPDLLVGCVAGAIQKEAYLKIIEEAGFIIERLEEDKEISKTQYEGVALESLKVIAKKAF